jgi:ketosteroid isomerase-like protein
VGHPNEDIVREGYAAFANGDLAVLRDQLFAEDIVWHFPGRSQFSGSFEGIDAVLDWLTRSAVESGGTLRVEVHDVLADDEHAVGLVSVSAEREGRSYYDTSVQVFHFRDGKASEVWNHPGDVYANDDFWG